MVMTSTELVKANPAECAKRFERVALAYASDGE